MLLLKRTLKCLHLIRSWRREANKKISVEVRVIVVSLLLYCFPRTFAHTPVLPTLLQTTERLKRRRVKISLTEKRRFSILKNCDVRLGRPVYTLREASRITHNQGRISHLTNPDKCQRVRAKNVPLGGLGPS